MITARADFGGGPQHLFLLVKYLKDQLNIFIACPSDFPYMERYKTLIGAENICIIPHRKFKIKSLFELKGFILRKNIKLIHSHGKGAGIYGRFLSLLTGCPAVHTFHGLHIDNYNLVPRVFNLTVERFLSLFTRKFVCVSKSEYNRVIAAKITSASKVAVINNGVEINQETVDEKLLDKEVKKILHVSRFDFAKNSLLLAAVIEALKEKKKYFKFIIIGSGEEEQEFKNRIIKKNLESYVEMKGKAEGLQNYLRESFCLISTSRWEGLPLSVMEAMSCGVPVVAANVPGNNDLVEHNQTGFLFDIQKPDEAAGYISLLMENSDLWKKFSLSSVEKIKKNFTAAGMAKETENLYLEIFKQHYK
ncbi:MAG TPA: glycosyltransferase [Ignavibacteriaceae bacterium]|nr:glycosyltransferase [Ignavibacteriaceae bacterium]